METTINRHRVSSAISLHGLSSLPVFHSLRSLAATLVGVATGERGTYMYTDCVVSNTGVRI
jgi:hypothetical protein